MERHHMRLKLIALSVLGLSLILLHTQVLAQRGGQRGGGRGGEAGGQRGGSSQHGGGFGGGLSSEGSHGGESKGGSHGGESKGGSSGEGSRGSPGMGPYGRESSGSGSASRPGTGSSGSNRPGTASAATARPGAEGASATRPGVQGSTATRPGTGTVPGAEGASATRPGAQGSTATRPGTTVNATSQTTAVGVRPGTSTGATGVAAAYAAHPTGTYHASTAALNDQGAAVRSAAAAYPAYSPATYGAHANAWPPTNLTSNSLYVNPGYGALAGQLGMAQQPLPYDYGGNVVAQSQAVYVNGDNVGPPQQYAAQASKIAATGNAQPAANTSWQPLGVFAMVEGDQTSSDDTFQLAVNPQGLLRGNYHNLRDNSVVSLSGSVDPKTQRAAWTIGGDKTPVYEAGIANLTKDEATMLLHQGEGQPRQFTLIRLQQPPQGN
jgi:hypothetical protein